MLLKLEFNLSYKKKKSLFRINTFNKFGKYVKVDGGYLMANAPLVIEGLKPFIPDSDLYEFHISGTKGEEFEAYQFIDSDISTELGELVLEFMKDSLDAAEIKYRDISYGHVPLDSSEKRSTNVYAGILIPRNVKTTYGNNLNGYVFFLTEGRIDEFDTINRLKRLEKQLNSIYVKDDAIYMFSENYKEDEIKLLIDTHRKLLLSLKYSKGETLKKYLNGNLNLEINSNIEQ